MNATIAAPARSVRPRPRGVARTRSSPVTDRRFILLGHLVRILIKYDGLEGSIGHVTRGDCGDGQVEVGLGGQYSGPVRRICFLSREVEIIPGNEIFRTGKSESNQLLDRSLRLTVLASLSKSELVQAACLRRKKPIDDVIAAMGRAKVTLAYVAACEFFGFKNPCSAIVPYVESGVVV